MTQAQRLTALFDEHADGEDILICDIYPRVMKRGMPEPAWRAQQQLGSVISRLHRENIKKGVGHRIVPGERKQSYRRIVVV